MIFNFFSLFCFPSHWEGVSEQLWGVINHNNILSLLGSLIPFGELRKGRSLLLFCYKHLTITLYSRRGPERQEMAQRSLLSFSCSAKSLIRNFQTIPQDFVAKVTSFLRTQISSRVITFPC